MRLVVKRALTQQSEKSPSLFFNEHSINIESISIFLTAHSLVFLLVCSFFFPFFFQYLSVPRRIDMLHMVLVRISRWQF